jgi:hypothetical protein
VPIIIHNGSTKIWQEIRLGQFAEDYAKWMKLGQLAVFISQKVDLHVPRITVYFSGANFNHGSQILMDGLMNQQNLSILRKIP